MGKTDFQGNNNDRHKKKLAIYYDDVKQVAFQKVHFSNIYIGYSYIELTCKHLVRRHGIQLFIPLVMMQSFLPDLGTSYS